MSSVAAKNIPPTLQLSPSHVGSSEDVHATLTNLVASITSGEVDEGSTLFENGIQSLRVGELRQKIEEAFGVGRTMQQLVDAESIKSLAADLHEAISTASPSSKSKRPFPHVNYESVNNIITEILKPKTGFQMPEHLDQLPYALYYILRKGLFTYLRIQYRDGLWNFVLNPPKELNLDLEVVVPGPSVNFHQTDFNAHFTVREIIRDSERGYYNLMHRNGIAHLEHHFGVMLFCSNLTSSFSKELAVNEPYEMRCRVIRVQGPLVDAQIAFHNSKGEQCFVVVWSLLLVINAGKKQMFDFELGRVTDAVETAEQEGSKLQPAHHKRADWSWISMWLAVFVAMFSIWWQYFH